jgi:hypothetical protein
LVSWKHLGIRFWLRSLNAWRQDEEIDAFSAHYPRSVRVVRWRGGATSRAGWGRSAYCNQRQERGACPPVCPTPVEMSPTVQGMGENLKKRPARGFALPDAAFPRYRHDCPRPPGGGGGGQRPGGVGVYCNQRQERGACPPVCPTPMEIPTTVQRMGENLKKRPARGFALPDAAFPGYRHDCHRPPRGGGGGGRRPGGVGDTGILQPETGEGAFCPLPVCPTPVEISPTVQCLMIRPGCGFP